jgi:hypothetical protein
LLLTFSLDIIRWQWLLLLGVFIALNVLEARQPDIAGIAYCAVSRQGHRAGRLQHHASVSFVLRRCVRGDFLNSTLERHWFLF